MAELISVATIKKSYFIQWMFESGYDDEIESTKLSLADRVLKTLLEGKDATVTVEELWEECNKEIITCLYFEEFSDDNTDEIGLYENITEYKLIEG